MKLEIISDDTLERLEYVAILDDGTQFDGLAHVSPLPENTRKLYLSPDIYPQFLADMEANGKPSFRNSFGFNK